MAPTNQRWAPCVSPASVSYSLLVLLSSTGLGLWFSPCAKPGRLIDAPSVSFGSFVRRLSLPHSSVQMRLTSLGLGRDGRAARRDPSSTGFPLPSWVFDWRLSSSPPSSPLTFSLEKGKDHLRVSICEQGFLNMSKTWV